MKIVPCSLTLLVICSVPAFPQIDASTYERAMISRGDNRPDFNVNDSDTKALIISLHFGVPPGEFQKSHDWTPEKYSEATSFLISKNFAYEKGGRFYPNCMVVSDREGRELFRYGQPLSQLIADAVVSYLQAVRDQYLDTNLSKTTAFERAAFLILSDVLLDNWQISNVETEFLGKERPLRHGKNYYFALLENVNPPRESFGIYGNAALKVIGVYGNNRKNLNADELQKRLGKALPLTDRDEAIFRNMASLFRPVLIDILKKNRAYIEDVYTNTGYSKEVSFEEFFIWWYHFIYTRATDILAQRGHLTIPEEGNIFYRRADASEQAAKGAQAVSPEADQVLIRYVEAVGGEAALLRLSSETRSGELKGKRGTFSIESYAVPGQWTFTFRNAQQQMKIRCRNATCWSDGDESRPITGSSPVEMASFFEMLFPLHVKEYFPSLQVIGQETQAGNSVTVLEGSSASLPRMRLAFDSRTGLLVQFGNTHFQDYRNCGGIRRPFTIVSPDDGRMTFTEIRHNQPLPTGVFQPGP